MPRRTISALRSAMPCLLLVVAGSCTKGAGLVDSFGSSYTVGGDGGGQDTGDGEESSDEGLSGPVDDDGGDPSGEPPAPGTGDCCVGQETPGCGDAAIEGCVCAQDAFCCENTWDDLCASLVEENMCGICEDAGGSDDGAGDDAPPDPSTDDGGDAGDAGDSGDGGGSEGGGTDGGGGTDDGAGDDGGGDIGNCCSAHAGTGCSAAAIETCVCATDSYCCDTEWDDICAGEVDSLGCGSCGGGGGTEGGTDDGGGTEGGSTDDGGEAGGGGDCCVDSAAPGCADATVEACVCAEDNYCCATAWDDICVGEVDSLGCGSCGGGGTTDDGGVSDAGGTTDDGGGGASECCVAQAGTGCAADAAVEACVCADDSWCCDVEWDDLCASEVESFGCGSCV